MERDFLLGALGEALARFGAPEIFNTNQGSQFTDADFTAPLLAQGVRVSMDGKGLWIDNVFVGSAVALREVRGYLPARPSDGARGEDGPHALLRVLQQMPATSEPRLSDAR